MANNKYGTVSRSRSNSMVPHEKAKLLSREEFESWASTTLPNSSVSSVRTPLLPRNRGNKDHQWTKNILQFILDQWFVITLGALVALSSQIQVPSSKQKAKTTIVTYTCVSLIFLITGCTLPTKTLIDNYSEWKIHLVAQTQCFLVTSAIAFGIVSAAAIDRNFMDPFLLIGIVLTSCVPTSISSNVVMTRKANGNTALTVVEATLGNLLGPFVTPLLVEMYLGTGSWWTKALPAGHIGSFGEIYERVFTQLGLAFFLPLIVGQLIQNRFPGPTHKFFVEWRIQKLGPLCPLLLIWQTFDQAFEAGAFSNVKSNNMIFVVLISFLHVALWMAIGLLSAASWMSRKNSIALAYVVPGKTPAMGVPLANILFLGLSRLEASKIQVPMVIYQGIQIFCASMLVPVLRKWAARDEEHDLADIPIHEE